MEVLVQDDVIVAPIKIKKRCDGSAYYVLNRCAIIENREYFKDHLTIKGTPFITHIYGEASSDLSFICNDCRVASESVSDYRSTVGYESNNYAATSIPLGFRGAFDEVVAGNTAVAIDGDAKKLVGVKSKIFLERSGLPYFESVDVGGLYINNFSGIGSISQGNIAFFSALNRDDIRIRASGFAVITFPDLDQLKKVESISTDSVLQICIQHVPFKEAFTRDVRNFLTRISAYYHSKYDKLTPAKVQLDVDHPNNSYAKTPGEVVVSAFIYN